MSLSNPITSSVALDQPWEKPWPANELERVVSCPVCKSRVREDMHKGLVDNVFYCAPGKWNSWRCVECRACYLDPRPTPESIHSAYSTYYTHQSVATKTTYDSLDWLRRVRRRLVNGYTNWRFSTREQPAALLAGPLLWFSWMQRRRLDREYRDLPRLPAIGGSLLDVGCGSGSFLGIARSCGWSTVGVDPDPKACMNARSQGFEVHEGGIGHFDGQSNVFDVITMSHVIEHVHDPVATLKACNRLLKPGGQLWLETPNIDSLGHWRYGRDWRGLEPPRHLVLFNQSSLTTALSRVGFLSIQSNVGPSPLLPMVKASEAIRHGLPSPGDVQISFAQRCKVMTGHILQAVFPHSREFLTVVARKDAKNNGVDAG